ncbi:hypothetical protein AVEN_5627-1 [Araneus ventricosus]|uniref:Uncharacterized protein n=1 Tax=Araneus ventricosus TaxID=182803 RepID=A0A4Y2Q541_ARAVE|nr:hypothetical protein AVEN_5627-1 [Araneus ventricosus]
MYVKKKKELTITTDQRNNKKTKKTQKASQNHAKFPLASEVVKSGSNQNVHRITSDLMELKEIIDNLKEIVTPLIELIKISGFGNDLNNFHSDNQPDRDNLRELNARFAKEVIELRAEDTRLKFSLESYVKGDPPSRIEDIAISSDDPFLGNSSFDVPNEQDYNFFVGETLVSSVLANS